MSLHFDLSPKEMTHVEKRLDGKPAEEMETDTPTVAASSGLSGYVCLTHAGKKHCFANANHCFAWDTLARMMR